MPRAWHNALLLGVYTNNDTAIGFYQRCGFGKIAERTFRVGEQYFEGHYILQQHK